MLSRFLKSLLPAVACATAAFGLAESEEPIAIKGIEIVQRSEARFPATMRTIGVKEGHVSVVLSVNEANELTDAFVVESSRRAFSDSVLKCLQDWSFTAAEYDGQPFPSTIRIDIDFEIDRNLHWQTFQAPVETNITQVAQIEQPITAAPIEELDAIPLPLEIVEPDQSLEGEATVEFYIDELGNVRCPSITAGTNLDFARVVLDAISQWRFQPPVVDGIRTNTVIRQTFHHQEGRLVSKKDS